MPKNAVGAEIGVFTGDFSDLILKICRPDQLHLIDLFLEGVKVLSPSKTGDRYLRIDGRELEKTVRAKYENCKQVKVHKGKSAEILAGFPDDYFDYIYIDGVKKDLEICRQKVKPGGWILGHDYNAKKYHPDGFIFLGCVKAVDAFCARYNLTLNYLTEPQHNLIDCQISYAIKNIK